MSTVEKRQYFENLDATRFLGFIHVFLAHCFFTSNPKISNSPIFESLTSHIGAGFLGLDYFFVLSSFLLTWLALAEWKSTDAFRPDLFMIRRALRLWPLYFAIVLGTYLIYWRIGNQLAIQSLPPLEVFLLFISNFWIANNGQNFLFLLVFLWSIAVEEQFYLAWAFVLRFAYKHLVLVCLLMMLGSLIFRWLNLNREPQLFFNTLSYLGNFGIGALTAWLAFYNDSFIKKIEGLSKPTIAFIYLFFIVLTLGYFEWFQSSFMVVIEKLVFGIFFAFVILEQSFAKHSLFKLGRLKRVSFLGQLSFGLYCIHGIVLTCAMVLLNSHGFAWYSWQVYLINPLLILSITIAISWISYSYFEKPIHQFRKHFYPKTSSNTSGV
jgi:peptidoglycan/LPS O-acetylase OafA/YrhL